MESPADLFLRSGWKRTLLILVVFPLAILRHGLGVFAIAWRKALGGVRVPRGVHRFKTHEEAEQWLWRMIARPTN